MTRRLQRWISPTGAALMASALLAAPATHAQTAWKPDRPVTLVVPYSPGGGTDATARAVSKQLGILWGQPVVVENLAGADGLIGTRRVMEARPDGYTVLLQVPSIVVTRYTPGLKGIDPLARLEPVTAVSQSPAAIVASAKVPARTLAEFIAYCKTSAQPCSVASGESVSRISARQLAAEAGIPNLIFVNYRGTSPIVADLLANNVNMAFTGITAALPHYKAGTLKIFATQGHQRAAALPEVPTSAEAGYPQFQSVTWYGLFAPKGTPAPVLQGYATALREAVKDADVRKAITAAGAEPVVNSPAEFAMQIREESERMGALVKRYPLE
ncbi:MULTISPECIES: tripartite tricarboxylate transporter substrate binding protein [unclassified Variovorax]|uniref:Bug family tripartite tricarboxylate transporter substrate binding protein n=1 Tax=unclassified Variovorax TaxID=663243 RepID=UPI001BD65E17|nr:MULTISPECIES: tripartite tricarboxylate transporter substrate binding protein [unclassified Variovorax]